jgi:hypothetical protein
MPDNKDTIYLPNSDENLLLFAKNIARAYGAIGQLSEGDVQQAEGSDDLTVVNDIIAKVPELTEQKRLEFCEQFIGDDENFNGATPAILADAYRALSARAKDGDDAAKEKLNRLAARIDDMSADFANSGGMIIDNGRDFPVVDLNNVADVYAGMASMLAARKESLNPANDAEKIGEIDKNLTYLNERIAEYDESWGLSGLNEKNAQRLIDRWEDVNDAVNRAELSDETKAATSKWKFYDKENKVIPQYVDAKGNTHEDYAPGHQIIKDGRMASMVEFARHDVVKKHAAKFDEKIDETALEQEVNDELMFKLYETSMADKVVQGAIDDPEQFINPEKRAAILKEITANGGEISDAGYNAAVQANCNSTAGWAARVKAKIGRGVQKIGGFFNRVFKPIERVDKMNNVRMTNVDANKKRRQLFLRILKGFASAFVASALITTIATAAAAVAGMSVALSFAVIGVVTGIGLAMMQVHRWRKERIKRGEPHDNKAFLADKRLLSSLGVSAIAVFAMCFGAAGLAEGAMALGYGALAIGGLKNAYETYKDARASNISKAGSIAWAIANAGLVAAGGFAGRAVANFGINAYNEAHPENEDFQNRVERQETHNTTRTETRMEYSQDALDNAERITKMWYQDNPDLLQQRVDAINAYNAEHGTNIDPYRAIMINGDAGGQTFDNMRLHVNNSVTDPNINDVYSGGNHRVMTDAWGRQYGYSHDDLLAARNLFNPDGSVNSAGMDVVSRLDNNVSVTNTIGQVPNRPVHTDNYFKPNDPEGWTTYTDGKNAFVENTYEVPDVETRTVVDYNPVTAEGMALATYGNYNLNKELPRDRVGAFPRQAVPVSKPKPVEPKPVEPGTKDIDWPKPVHIPRQQEMKNDADIVDDKQRVIITPPPAQREPETTDEEQRVIITPPPAHREPETTDWPKPVRVPQDKDIIKYSNDDDEQTQSIRQLPPHLRGYLPADHEHEEQQILVTPPHEEMIRGRLNPGRPDLPPFDEIIGNKDEWPNVPHREMRELPIHGTPDLALTFAQAKDWYKWHDNLEKVQKKRQKNPNSAKAQDLHRQEKDLINRINHLRNVLGGASDEQIYAACPEAIRRGRLTEAMAALAKHELAKPKGEHAYARMPQWEKEQAEILARIENLGGPDSLSENYRYQAIPVKGVQAQKKALRNQPRVQMPIINEPVQGDTEDIEFEEIESVPNEPMPQQEEQSRVIITPPPAVKTEEIHQAEPERPEPIKQEKVSETVQEKTQPQPTPVVQPVHKESVVEQALDTAKGRDGKAMGNRAYFTPFALKQLADNPEVLQRPLTYWHGEPVKLVDFSGRGIPVMQSREQPVVVVKIGEYLVPFYLTTGLNSIVEKEIGRWRPLYGIGYDGTLYTGQTTNQGSGYEALRGLDDVAAALDEKIGDIRNWRDNKKTDERNKDGLSGFIGGCNVMPVMDVERVCNALYDNKYREYQIYGLNQSDDVGDYIMASQAVLAQALDGVKSQEHKAHFDDFGTGMRRMSKKLFDRLTQRFGKNGQDRKQ